MSRPAPSGRRLLFGPRVGPGRLITVDGLDGSGKTTVVDGLRAELERTGIPVLTTRLPSTRMRETEFFRVLRGEGRTDLVDPLAFEIAYMVDRVQHCRTVIDPALRGGVTVVTDRYAFSSVGTLLLRLPELRAVALDAVLRDAWFADLCGRLTGPDLSLVLVADSAVGVQRLRARPGERDVDFTPDEYTELQEVLLDLAAANDMVPVDSNDSPERTVAACLAHLVRPVPSGPRR